MKRFLIGLTVLLLLFALLALGVAAEETEVPTGENAADGASAGDIAGGTETGNNTASGDGEMPGNTATPGDAETDIAARATVGGRIAAFFEEHVGEIFSALTLVGSLALMCGYKRGFLPALCRGLDCVTRSTENFGRQALEVSEDTGNKIGSFLDGAAPLIERAEQILAVAETLRDRAAALEEKLAVAEDDRAREETLWRGVADLLYGVFSAANLPDYAKEQLGARYAALLAVASPEEGTDAGTGV